MEPEKRMQLDSYLFTMKTEAVVARSMQGSAFYLNTRGFYLPKQPLQPRQVLLVMAAKVVQQAAQ